MAKSGNLQHKATQSKLGRGLGALIPVPIERPGVVVPGSVALSVAPSSPAPVPSDGRPLVPVSSTEPKPSPGPARVEPGTQVVFLPIRSIQPGKYQPRGSMDPRALEALARSIEQSGLMQPIVVRPLTGDPGRYELIAGERRWRALDQLGRLEVPAIIQAVGDRDAAELALVENLQREDLNPMDRASALRRLADEFRLTHQDVAARVGIDRATVTNLVRLLELDAATAALVRSGALSLGHAKVLLGVPDASSRHALASQAASQDWSVRQLEEAVRDQAGVPRGTSRRGGRGPAAGSAHLADLCRQLEAHLGTRVTIRVGRSKGSGELRVQFFSLDEFDGLMQRIGFKGDRMVV